MVRFQHMQIAGTMKGKVDSWRQVTKGVCIYIFEIIYFLLCWVFNGLCILIAVHGFFSSCSEQGLLLVVVHRLPIVVASVVAEHML